MQCSFLVDSNLSNSSFMNFSLDLLRIFSKLHNLSSITGLRRSFTGGLLLHKILRLSQKFLKVFGIHPLAPLSTLGRNGGGTTRTSFSIRDYALVLSRGILRPDLLAPSRLYVKFHKEFLNLGNIKKNGEQFVVSWTEKPNSNPRLQN